jgi:hypothetical protein
MKHTPGPWIAFKNEFHRLVVRGMVNQNWPQGGATVCEWLESRSGAKRGQQRQWRGFTERQEADARLIAAAPQLLDALILLVSNAQMIPDPHMNNATDCYRSTLDDIDNASALLKSIGVMETGHAR